MVISLRGVIQSTSCLVLHGVSGSVDRIAISGFAKSKMAEKSNGDISAADHPIYSVFGSRTGFSVSAD